MNKLPVASIAVFVAFMNCGGVQGNDVGHNETDHADQGSAFSKTSPTPTVPSEKCNVRLAEIRLLAAKDGDARGAEEYGKAIESGCDSAYAHYVYGLSLKGSGHNEAAATQLRTVIMKEPKNWAAHWELARLLIVELNDFDAGLRELEIAKDLDDLKDLGFGYKYYQGRALEGKGDTRGALLLYRSFENSQAKVNKHSDEYRDVILRIERLDRLIKSSPQPDR